MSSLSLIISPVARDDLRNIYQFGLRRWGEAQSSKYLDALNAALWALTKHPEMGIERKELLADLRSLAVASHIIFYRPNVKPGIEQVEIVRVLDGRQDPKKQMV